MEKLQIMVCIMKNKLLTISSFFLIVIVWKVLTLFFSPFVVPKIPSVLQSMYHIVTEKTLYRMIGITTIRLMIGLLLGIVIGMIVGISMGYNRIVKALFLPLITLFQTIPPVSWLVLSLVWFGFNGKPAIFIVVTATIPIIAINISQGIECVDTKLIEMAQLFRFSVKKKYQSIILPSIIPYFKSALRISMGSAWKIAVMGEVLTTSDGIGGMIKLARLNIEPENIIAWSIIVVLLFYISDFTIHLLFFRREKNHA